MKITTFILLVACLKVSATANGQQVTLSQKNVSIEKVFKEIKKQIGYSFLYTDELLQKASKVTVEVKNTPLNLVLDQLFINQPLAYTIVDQTIIVKNKEVLVANELAAIAPPIKVTGKITGDNNQPLEAVSIQVKGTNLGTSTKADGSYLITVAEPSAILVFSSIGYETKEVKVGSNTNISFTMVAKSTKVEEIVVVGYGTQRKKDVTGSVASIGEKALREVPVANIQSALQGRIAGLEVQQVGTRPGAGAVIRIRGERTINGSNDPLIILDGIPFEGGSLNDINPNKITSINVLKDASATAIYGSRGSNGVILITTKKGKAGEAKVAYNGYVGSVSVRTKYNVFNAQEYIALRDFTNINPYMPEELVARAKGQSTNWQDLMYKNGIVTDQNLSVSGGTTGGSSFSLGGGYYNQTTVLPGQDFTRYSLRATIDTKVGKKFKFGLNTMNTLGITNGSQFNNPMFPIITLSPLMQPYDSLGNLVLSPTGNTTDRVSQYNPLLLKNNDGQWVDKIRRLRTFNTLYGEYQIAKGLKYRLNVGLDYRLQENDQFQKSDKPLSPSYFRPKQGNTASVTNSEGYGYTLENIVTYDKTIGKHKFSVTGLYSFQEDHSHSTSVSKDSIDEDFIQFYNLGQANASNNVKPVVSGSEVSYALESYMVRLNYSFNDKYLLTLTERLDGSSRLAPGNKYHDYPAISVGWNITSEKFMSKINYLDNLKLRAGLGQTSNQSVNPYTSLGLVSPYNYNGYSSPSVPGGTIRYNFGPSTIVTGYNLVTLPNPNLDWEYTKTINLGLDFSFLKGRITGSIEWYKSNTNKILYGIALPVTSGVSGSYTTNIGEMENKGLEFSISTTNVKLKNGFTWSTDLNLFGNRNKLLQLTDGFTRNIASQLFIGQPLSAIYDYNKLGIWQLSEAAEAAKFGNLPGDIKLEDVNGDGKIDANNDRKIIGSGQAKIQGGLTNRFTFKNFDFSFVMYARFGGLVVSQIHQPYAAYTNVQDGLRNTIKTNYWTPTNASNDAPIAGFLNRSRPASTDWTTLGYYDASFIKVRSINLGYTLSSALITKMKIQSFRAYVAVQNPFVLYSPYMRDGGGVDPEATGTGNQGVQNPGNLSGRALTIGLNTPPTLAVNVGFNITF